MQIKKIFYKQKHTISLRIKISIMHQRLMSDVDFREQNEEKKEEKRRKKKKKEEKRRKMRLKLCKWKKMNNWDANFEVNAKFCEKKFDLWKKLLLSDDLTKSWFDRNLMNIRIVNIIW